MIISNECGCYIPSLIRISREILFKIFDISDTNTREGNMREKYIICFDACQMLAP